ncbi:WhiB family transcriptional regulator [Streptomyces sp. NPDC060048]|uniref:WhiB family transcriptional regulator n=1 Tax=unclassified Streptomyces TaxID=2593676 RepID=UPI0036B18D56
MSLATASRSRPHADTDRADHWADRARCKNRLDEFWASEEAARTLCAACPVRLRCLSDALREEGQLSAAYREGIRGGLDPRQRATLTLGERPAPADTPSSRAEAEELLRAAELCDRVVSERSGLRLRAVVEFRRELGLPPVRDTDRRPLLSRQERFDRRTLPGDDGHLLWTGHRSVQMADGRAVSSVTLAFELGHGRPPEGVARVMCGQDRCVAWQHLADRPMREALTAAAKPPATAQLPAVVEYLYGVEPAHWEGDRVWVGARVVRFRIIRKTRARVFYARTDRGGVSRVGSVNRVRLEADGDVYRGATTGWWEPDKRLYLTAPVLDPGASVRPSPAALADLKTAMTAAHPDHGGTDEAFMAAHAAYQQARRTTTRAQR